MRALRTRTSQTVRRSRKRTAGPVARLLELAREWLEARLVPGNRMADRARTHHNRYGYTPAFVILALIATLQGLRENTLRILVGGYRYDDRIVAAPGSPLRLVSWKFLVYRARAVGARRLRRLGWLQIEQVPGRAANGRLQVQCQVHVRKWHPGFWLYVLRNLQPIHIRVRVGR